ncbi:hypothetical protein [uncultured Methylibium sp.]|uniref:hypothetical protein n=1 Tax=uncultured Methylibium sp. TaxID=381093 RepID=UPI0025D96838|nr:hypothetical protein [uncultured Methylibium sp.]
MKLLALPALSAALLLSACAGVDVTPISSTAREDLHKADPQDAYKHARRGYVVYEPMLLVSVAPGRKCLGELKEGKCNGSWQDVCEVSEPKLFPNYNRPYLVKARSGFGKAGTEITISNGWQLGSIKDHSDNTAVLAALRGKESSTSSFIPDNSKSPNLAGCTAGVYMVPSSCESGRAGSCQWQPWKLNF